MLINLRNALMSGKRKPTAKDYVQSGLVANWVWSENVGYGQFDASATEWVNLVDSTKSLSWGSGVAGVSWTNGGLLLENNNKTALSIATTNITVPTATTVRIVASYDWKFLDSTANLQVPIYWYGTTVPCARYRGKFNVNPPGLSVATTYNGRFYAYRGFSSLSGAEPTSCSVIGPAAATANLMCNRVVETLTRDYNGAMSFTNGDIELIRTARADVLLKGIQFYSRALTTAEEAINRAVDIALFNLPTGNQA